MNKNEIIKQFKIDNPELVAQMDNELDYWIDLMIESLENNKMFILTLGRHPQSYHSILKELFELLRSA